MSEATKCPKPCPLCGGPAEVFEQGRFFGVQCSTPLNKTDCGLVRSYGMITEDAAIGHWNNRPYIDGLVAACEDLASIKGKIPEFLGSASLEIARDSARDALAQHAEPETETVELVVGGEYEVKLYIVHPEGEPTWAPARCVSLGRAKLAAPLFEFERSGSVLQGHRVDGEYRNVRNAEAVT